MRASKKIYLWTIFSLLIIIFIFGYFNSKINLISPYVKPNLKNVAGDSLYQTTGRYGIYIKNLKTQESFALNEDQKFDPGSLYKLKLMVLVFEKIKDGSLKEDKSLIADIKELNEFFEISDDVAEFNSGTIEFSVKSALEQMITISHNYAALILTKELKAKDLAKNTTPKAMADFFEKLYKGEVIDQEYSGKMLELLKKQKINDRIPRFLPKEVAVAHKTGDIEFFEHDAGIVYTPSGDYIFVAMSESDMPDAAGGRIAKLSEAVYKYFTKY